MKKTVSMLCILLMMTAFMPVTSYGAEVPTATFDGSSEIKYNYSDTDNFGEAFHGMMPGEERQQEMILENTSDKTASFYMEVEVIRALEETYQETKGAGYDFYLSVTQDGVNNGAPQMIYSGSNRESAWIGADSEGLGNLNRVLENYGKNGINVATLAPGEQAVIRLGVTLDGVSAENAYQDVNGTFQFAFHASYDEPETITKTTKEPDKTITRTVRQPDKTVTRTVTRRAGSTVTSRIAAAVKTGDMTVIAPLVFALAGCTAVIFGIVIMKKKKKNAN